MNRFGTLLIAMCAVVGCVDDERYFCVSDGPLSERGCFLCRDDECVRQPAPERAMCLEETDCAVLEVCTSIGCVPQCDEDLDCPLGTACASTGLCLNPLEDEPTRRSPPTNTPTPQPEPDPVPACQFNFECDDGRIYIKGDCRFTSLDSPR